MRFIAAGFIAMGFVLQSGCASISAGTATRTRTPASAVASRYLEATDFEKRDKLEQAREIYQELLDKNPQNADYMHRLAVVCTRLQRNAEAASFYERARKLDPDNAALLADMGYFYYLNGDLPESERMLRKALHLKPSYVRATNNLALVVGVKGDLEESLSLLQRIGNGAQTRASLGYIHQQRGETTLATALYREALKIDPKLTDASRALARLTKDNPELDTFVAETTPDEMGTTRPNSDESDSDRMPKPLRRSSEIQLTAGTADKLSRNVITADFTEESPAAGEPALLKMDDDFAMPPASEKEKQSNNDKTAFDDIDWGDEKPSKADSNPSKPVSNVDWDDK